MSAIPRFVVVQVNIRAAGTCEACGHLMAPEDGVLHHRKLRSQGGKHTVANLMRVHPACHNGHTNSIHNVRVRSERLGHLLKMGEDPELIGFTAEYGLLGTTS